MKPHSFHPEEKLSGNQFSHMKRNKEVAALAETKGLKMTRASFGVGHFLTFPDGKRQRFTSYTKLVEFVAAYNPATIEVV